MINEGFVKVMQVQMAKFKKDLSIKIIERLVDAKIIELNQLEKAVNIVNNDFSKDVDRIFNKDGKPACGA